MYMSLSCYFSYSHIENNFYENEKLPIPYNLKRLILKEIPGIIMIGIHIADMIGKSI